MHKHRMLSAGQTLCLTSLAKICIQVPRKNYCYDLNHNKNAKLKQRKWLYSAENKHRPSRRPV